MDIAPDDLRLSLGLPVEGFDHPRAMFLLRRAVSRVRTAVGGLRFDQDTEDESSPQFEAAKDVALSYAARLWVNPEGSMQYRFSEFSRSMADSVDAATGLTKSERRDLRAAFGATATTLQL